MEPERATRRKIALQLIFITTLTIFGVELGVMRFLPPFPKFLGDLLDSTILTLIALPVLYLVIIRPLLDLIEKQKELESVLRESEEKFRNLAAAAYDAIAIMDEKGNVSFWNKGAERVFGYREEEIIGQSLHDLLCNSEDRRLFEKAFIDFKKTGIGPVVGKTRELTASHKDGTFFPIELSLSALNIKGSWHSIGVVRDISERKRIEPELRHHEELLRTLSENLAKAQEMAHLGNWVWTIEEDVATCSDEFYRILGLSPQSRWITYTVFMEFVHPEDRPLLEKILERVRVEKEPFYRDFRIIRQDSKETFVHLRADVILDESGNVVQLFGILQDVTERKRLEDEVSSILIEKERLDTLHTIAMTYAHHVLNGITPVQGFAELLLKKMDPSDPRYATAKLIVESSANMVEVVKKLKDLETYQPLKIGGVKILDIEGNNKDQKKTKKN